jgi:hypothetical protein
MGEIQYALSVYEYLINYKYKFVISHRKTVYYLELTFNEKDFLHIAGLHYLSDIDIPRTPKILFHKIKNNKIDDEYLAKSVYYLQIKDSYAKVKNRIYALKFLEKFLDNKNLICKYVKYKNIYSNINADYLIKSTVDHMTAYIFLKNRNVKNNTYCICSFFLETDSKYNGVNVYWLYKSKVNLDSGEEFILYDRLDDEIKKLYAI